MKQYFVDTLFSKEIFVVLLTYWCILRFYLIGFLPLSFIFNCECHLFRWKPQIKEPKSLYFVKFSIL